MPSKIENLTNELINSIIETVQENRTLDNIVGPFGATINKTGEIKVVRVQLKDDENDLEIEERLKAKIRKTVKGDDNLQAAALVRELDVFVPDYTEGDEPDPTLVIDVENTIPDALTIYLPLNETKEGVEWAEEPYIEEAEGIDLFLHLL